MAQILVNPDTLRAKASDVRSYRNQHDEIIARLKALVSGLNETWQGNAQTAFVSNFDGMQSTFTQFSELLEDYAKTMESFANKMESEDRL